MEELIKYFESLEARIAAQEERLAAQEERLAALESELTNLKNRPAPEPQVVEKVVEKIVEKPVEVIKEVVVEKPVVVAAPIVEPEPVAEQEPVAEPEPKEEIKEDIKEEPSPNAAIYGKAVDDIRQAISLGDRFLFQRELFGQNAEQMQRTLDDLNRLGSFDEALEYVNTHFQWDTESPTYQQFVVTLHRRFG